MAVRYRPHVAIDPQGRLITELVGIPVTIVAAGTTTPLPISEDSDGSIPIAGSQLTVTSQNIIPGFWVQDDTAEADAVSGPYRVSIDSLTGVKELALDSATAAQAAQQAAETNVEETANVAAAATAATFTDTYVPRTEVGSTVETPAGAQAKADAAEVAAKDHAETLAYGTNLEATDTVVAGFVDDPGSQTGAALVRTYVGRPGVRPFLTGKLFGGNIVPAPDTWGWRDLFSEWDWDNWIRPQVDRAQRLGMNAVRLIGNPSVTMPKSTAGSTSPAITLTNYVERWVQLARYCESLGIALYPCLVTQGSDFDDMGIADNMDPTVTAAVQASADALAVYPNVIAFDIFQEGGNNSTLTAILAMMSAVREVAPNIPLTSSHPSSGSPSMWLDTAQTTYKALLETSGSDLADYHIYMAPRPSDPDVVTAATGKPLLIGEFGANQSESESEAVARFASVAQLHNRPGILGSFVWGLADQKTSATPDMQYGVWDNTGYVAGATPLSITAGRRTYLTDALRAFSIDQVPGRHVEQNLLNPIQARPRQASYGWVSAGNAIIGASTDRGLTVQANGAGDVSVTHATPTGQRPVVAGAYYDARVDVLAAAVARTVHLVIAWYDENNAYLTVSGASVGTDSVLVPWAGRIVTQAPANAAYGALRVRILAAEAGEVHYINNAEIRRY